MIPWQTALKRLLNLLVSTEEMKKAQLSLLSRPDVTSIRSLWFEIYLQSIDNEVFELLESLPQEEKQSIWDYTKELAPNLPIEEKIKVSKCLYTIEYYLNNPL